MITAERLEELIKQGAMIYYVLDNNLGYIELNYCFASVSDGALRFINIFEHSVPLTKLFETKDRAEWALKTVAERTERFEPPMWEDMQKILQQEPYYNFVFVKNNSVYEFVVSDKLGVRNYDCIDLDKCLFFGNSTKENYIKACEIVRDLFNKGGAK